MDLLAKNLMPLANDPEKTIRLLLAISPNTPAKVLGELVDDESDVVRSYLINRFLFPRDELIRYFAGKKNAKNFWKVPSLRASLCAELSNSRNPYVRGMVARNSKCPAVVRAKLSKDSSWFVKAQLANNPTVRRLGEKKSK